MSEPTGERTLAEAVDTLIRKRAALDGKSDLSVEAVAGAIRARGGSVSHTTIWNLRSGREDNPRKKTLQALADWGGVPIEYFFDEMRASEIDEQLDRLLALTGLRTLAARLGQDAELTSAELRAAADAVLRVRQGELEGEGS